MSTLQRKSPNDTHPFTLGASKNYLLCQRVTTLQAVIR